MDKTTMDDNKMGAELVEALQSIQAELKRINQTLSGIAASSGQSSRPAPYASDAPAKARPRTSGSFKRSEMSAPPAASGAEGGSRFPKRKSAAPAGAGRPKSKPPGSKRGEMYPKKPR